MKQTLTEIVDLITTFDNTTQEAEHTDSGDAWTLLNEIRDTADRALGRPGEHCATWAIFNTDWGPPEGWYHIQRDDSEDFFEDDESAAAAHFDEIVWCCVETGATATALKANDPGTWRVIARCPKTTEAKKAVIDWHNGVSLDLLTPADRTHIENTTGIVVCDAGRMNTDEETGERWASCWVRMPKAEPTPDECCLECGGTNVERLVWVNAQTLTRTYGDPEPENWRDNYCNDCEKHVRLGEVSEERCAECGEEREDDAHTCSRTRWNTEDNSNE